MTGHVSSWAEARLDEVVDILDSKRVPVNAEERTKRQGTVPYYGATGQVGWIDRSLFDEELLLLGEDGAPFLDAAKPKAYVISGPSWVNNHAHVLRARSRVTSNRFLMHYLNTVDFHGYATGTTRLKLTQAAMRPIPVPLPPLAEQRRITDTIEEQFSRLDAAEESLGRCRVGLRVLRAAVLEDAFAALSGAVRLGNLAVSISDGPFGSNLKSSHYTSSGPRVIRLANIGEGVFVDEKAHISEEHFRKLEKYSVREGDLVLASLGDSALRSCVVPGWVIPAIVKADCVRVRFDGGVDSRFVNFALQRPSVWRQARKLIHGVGRLRLGIPAIRSLEIPVASAEQQATVIEEIDLRLSLVAAMDKEVNDALLRSEVLRRAILEEAFAGRLVSQDPFDASTDNLLHKVTP
jgi:type I restriction enzyme S subunit